MNYLNTQDAGILYAKVLNDRIYVDKSLLIREVSSMLGTSSLISAQFPIVLLFLGMGA